jgi:hypothetical protein
LNGNLRSILLAETLLLVWRGFTAPYVRKTSLLLLVARGEHFARVALEGECRIPPNILIEEVIPEVPTRQWVLSMPYAYRFLLARNPDFLRKALAIFHRTLSRHYEKKARILNLKNPKTGAITVVQRFGGALNLNVHFHTIYIDGVFYENNFGDEVFFEIVPTHAEVVQINATLKKRLMRLLDKFEHEDHDR